MDTSWIGTCSYGHLLFGWREYNEVNFRGLMDWEKMVNGNYSKELGNDIEKRRKRREKESDDP